MQIKILPFKFETSVVGMFARTITNQKAYFEASMKDRTNLIRNTKPCVTIYG